MSWWHQTESSGSYFKLRVNGIILACLILINKKTGLDNIPVLKMREKRYRL